MATFIETNSIKASGSTKPTDAGTLIRDEQWGIDATLSGYIIQSVSTNHTRTYDTTQDQKGATVSELDYDENWEVTLTVIGGNGSETGDLDGIVVGDTDFTWDNKKWKVRSCTYNGSYNAKKQYTISIWRSKNFPAQA